MSDQPRVPAGSPKGGQWAKMYHGTTRARADSISKEGLIPREQDKAAGVYLTPDRKAAEWYADYTAKQEGGAPVVIEVNVPESEQGKLTQSTPTQVRYGSGDRIPPEWLSIPHPHGLMSPTQAALFAERVKKYGPNSSRGNFAVPPPKNGKYSVNSSRLTHEIDVMHDGTRLVVDSKITKPNWLEEVTPKAAEMTVSMGSNGVATGRIDARRHGKGYGRETFQAVLKELPKFGIKEYHAYVEHGNLSSQDMVKKSGGEVIKEGPHGKTYRVRVVK